MRIAAAGMEMAVVIDCSSVASVYCGARLVSVVLDERVFERSFRRGDSVDGEFGDPFENGVRCSLVGEMEHAWFLFDYAYARQLIEGNVQGHFRVNEPDFQAALSLLDDSGDVGKLDEATLAKDCGTATDGGDLAEVV